MIINEQHKSMIDGLLYNQSLLNNTERLAIKTREVSHDVADLNNKELAELLIEHADSAEFSVFDGDIELTYKRQQTQEEIDQEIQQLEGNSRYRIAKLKSWMSNSEESAASIVSYMQKVGLAWDWDWEGNQGNRAEFSWFTRYATSLGVSGKFSWKLLVALMLKVFKTFPRLISKG